MDIPICSICVRVSVSPLAAAAISPVRRETECAHCTPTPSDRYMYSNWQNESWNHNNTI